MPTITYAVKFTASDEQDLPFIGDVGEVLEAQFCNAAVDDVLLTITDVTPDYERPR